MVDDAARYAETVNAKDRLPLYDTNGLNPCDKLTFSREHKERVKDLLRPR